jgi:hypothetical protein
MYSQANSASKRGGNAGSNRENDHLVGLDDPLVDRLVICLQGNGGWFLNAWVWLLFGFYFLSIFPLNPIGNDTLHLNLLVENPG